MIIILIICNNKKIFIYLIRLFNGKKNENIKIEIFI